MSKYTIEALTRMSETATTPAQRGKRTAARTQGTSFYGTLPTNFPTHYAAFMKMHDHALERDYFVSSAFARTATGLINFIMNVGPLPRGHQGTIHLLRKHVNRGFVRNNLEWVGERNARREIGVRNAAAF